MKYWDMETGQCILTMDILWAMSSSKAERRQAGFLFDSHIFDGGEFIGALQFRDVGLASGTEDGAIRMWDCILSRVILRLFFKNNLIILSWFVFF
jgi:mitochondrial division protein 1